MLKKILEYINFISTAKALAGSGIVGGIAATPPSVMVAQSSTQNSSLAKENMRIKEENTKYKEGGGDNELERD